MRGIESRRERHNNTISQNSRPPLLDTWYPPTMIVKGNVLFVIYYILLKCLCCAYIVFVAFTKIANTSPTHGSFKAG